MVFSLLCFNRLLGLHYSTRDDGCNSVKIYLGRAPFIFNGVEFAVRVV